MIINLQVFKKISFTDFVLMLSIIMIGGFHELSSCILSVIMSAYLILKFEKSGELNIRLNLISVSVFVICLLYGFTAFWAVDFGMAIIGFLKFLPLVIYLLAIFQNGQSNFKIILPYFSAVIVIVTFIGMHIEITKNYFSVAGRLAGSFQYPNTFALLLLVSQLFLFEKKAFKWFDYVTLFVLLFGIFYTGSRTVFVLTILANVILGIYKFRKGIKKKAFFLVLSAILASAVLLFIFNNDIFQRFLKISFAESTFIGRLLYFQDAIPLILKHPFGLGYLGYYYLQTSIQTGVYTIRYIHNDFLQLILDIGWVPALLFGFAVVKTIFQKRTSFNNKVIISTICLHSLFDFNLQFVSIFFLLIMLLDVNYGKQVVIKKQRLIFNLGLVLILSVNLYMSVHLALMFFGKNDLADKLYKYNTENKVAILTEETNLENANKIADEILMQNSASYIPYTIKAKYYYSKGDFLRVIENENIVFEKYPFNYTEYEQYCRMLMNGIYLYNQNGDNASVKYCQGELLYTKNRLLDSVNLLSELGKKIKDQPITELSEEISSYINKLEAEYNK